MELFNKMKKHPLWTWYDNFAKNYCFKFKTKCLPCKGEPEAVECMICIERSEYPTLENGIRKLVRKEAI